MARQIATALKAAGFATWLYQENSLPGRSYLQQIHTAVSHSDVVAVLLSVSSLGSHQVDKELALGHDLGKPFMPVLLGISHEKVRTTKPEYGVVFGASVSIPVSEAGFLDSINKIIQGLQAIISKSLAPPATSETTPQPVTSKTPGVPDEWEQLSRRLQNYHPEIARIRQWLCRRWPKSDARGSEGSLDGSIPATRVRIADELLIDLVDVVGQEWAPVPREFALVARGGFGRGVLSVGSDIDVTLVHVAAETKAAEAFWGSYGTELANCWNAVRGIRVAPIILTEEDCQRSWAVALERDDLAPLVSFAFSRHIAGSAATHDRLRTTWREFIRGMTVEKQKRLFERLKRFMEERELNSALPRFNIKSDAGGLLEYRLTGFCEQWFDVKSPENKQPSWSVPASHHFLLNLREAVFHVTRAHVLTDTQFARVAATMFPEASAADQIDTLVEEVARHRRRIRSGLNAAVQSCSEVIAR